MKSIRAALTLRLLLGGASLLAIAGSMLHWQVARALTSEVDASLRATVQALATITEQRHGRIKIEIEDGNMPQFDDREGREFYLLRTVDGREIARSVSIGNNRFPLRSGTPEAPALFDVHIEHHGRFRCASIRFTPGSEDEDERADGRSEPVAQAILVVGKSRRDLDRTLTILDASLAGVGLGAAAALTALVGWAVRSGVTPLAALGEKIARVDATSLSARLPVDHLPVELRPIVEKLNDLVARLEAAFGRERRFTSTAAHELRTPLAELRAVAEVNLSTPGSEAERVESWRDALAATLRMESLALRLLELARAEDPALALQWESVSLADALANAWRPCAERATEREIQFENEVPPECKVRSDPVILGVILGNLCANAAAHGAAGAPLRINARIGDQEIAVQFRNRAPDLQDEDVPHLFERFWRKEVSRTDARRHGLGLALSAEFARLLGGTLTARLDGDELELTLVLAALP